MKSKQQKHKHGDIITVMVQIQFSQFVTEEELPAFCQVSIPACTLLFGSFPLEFACGVFFLVDIALGNIHKW